ncbi:hypothetical protein PEC730217_22470 [Pectobacterium carotovorum subsp. carotovorum]|nr:hypothetical protein PEC730217_22470 [Pectobacterium carotovorum subsp. carotovorum]
MTASRAGSHAGRGFRYQDAVGVWLVIRCWANEIPYRVVIPEGKDDYELSSTIDSALVQVKSRRDHLGPFPVAVAAGFIRDLWARFENYASHTNLILVLEHPVAEGPVVNHLLAEHPALVRALQDDLQWSALSALTQIWIVPNPFEAAVKSIHCTMPCSDLAAQIHYGELLKQIAALADKNGLMRDGHFEELGISDVEASLRRIEPALDMSGMELALRDGYCDVVDFLTPFNDPFFYLGVNTRPGHVAAGFVAERPNARYEVLSALESAGAALIVGLSGAGKSALMWETARASRHTTRWFEMRRGDAADVHLLIQFTRALRASPDAPVGFVFDDVGGRFSQLWNALLKEVTVGSGILLLGSIREEDTLMLASRSRAREVRPLMEEAVAEKIWRQLVEQGQTNWAGWREPWAKSSGLLLEYTHILTRGERLKSILAEQIDQRLRESRDEELAVLSVTALAGAAGSAVDVSRLPKVLGIEQGPLTRALRRLIDEHLVSTPVDGQLKGLHQLRSKTLFELCHTHLLQTPSHAVISTALTVKDDSLSSFVSYVSVHIPDAATSLIEALVTRLEKELSPVALNGSLFGLGQAHIETTLRTWIPQARVIGVEPTLITLAVMFVVAGQNTSITLFPERLQKAMDKLRVRSATDPRQVLLSALSPDTINALVVRADTPRLCTFMGTLVGMDIPDSIRAALSTLRPDFDAINLSNAAELLGAARLIDPQIAIVWGADDVRERLLARLTAETPWTDKIEVEATPDGHLLHSRIFHVAPSVQNDVHEEVVHFCELLLGLDPTAAVVAVDAIAADSLLSGLSEYPVATKRIPRENLPTKALPEWNKRWIAAAAKLVGTESYSAYLQRAYALLEQLMPVLERIVDCVLRGKIPPPKIIERFGEVFEGACNLTSPQEGLSTGEAPEQHVKPLQNLLHSCSADLVRRFNQLPENYGAFVIWTGDLLKNVWEARSEPWPVVGMDPEPLLMRLENILASLRLLAAEAGSEASNPSKMWIEKTRKAQRGNALRLAKVEAERQLKTRSERYLLHTEARLQASGIELTLYARPEWKSLLTWPNVELLAVVDLEMPADWLLWLNEHVAQIRSDIGESRQIWIIPRIAGFAVSQLTVGGVSSLFSSPHDVDDWIATLSIPQLDDTLVRLAQPIIDLVIELDGLRRFRLGGDNRPILEQTVRQIDEHKLEMALLAFDASSAGTSVHNILRMLSEDVASGAVNLARDVAALTHGRSAPGAEILVNIQNALLAQDIANAISN